MLSRTGVEPPLRCGTAAREPVRAESACELLRTGTAHEVLARIVPEDPLGLRARIGSRLAELALLCDLERVLLTAQALCALEARSWRGEPELSGWLAERVEEALATVLAEDGGASERRLAEPFPLFAAQLALDAHVLAAACGRFNRLPFEQREAFFALVLDAGGADRLARARGLSLSELARRARAGLEPFLRVTASVPSVSAS